MSQPAPDVEPEIAALEQLRFFAPSKLLEKLAEITHQGNYHLDPLRGVVRHTNPREGRIREICSKAFYTLNLGEGNDAQRVGAVYFQTGVFGVAKKDIPFEYEYMALKTEQPLTVQGRVVPVLTIKVDLFRPKGDEPILTSERFDRRKVTAGLVHGWRRVPYGFFAKDLPTSSFVADKYSNEFRESYNEEPTTTFLTK